MCGRSAPVLGELEWCVSSSEVTVVIDGWPLKMMIFAPAAKIVTLHPLISCKPSQLIEDGWLSRRTHPGSVLPALGKPPEAHPSPAAIAQKVRFFQCFQHLLRTSAIAKQWLPGSTPAVLTSPSTRSTTLKSSAQSVNLLSAGFLDLVAQQRSGTLN